MKTKNKEFKKGDIVLTRCNRIYQLVDEPINHRTWGACANVREYRTKNVHGMVLRHVQHHPFFVTQFPPSQ